MQLCIRHGYTQHARLHSSGHAANQCVPPTLSKLHTTADISSSSRSCGITPMHVRSPAIVGTIRAAAAGRRTITAATGTDKDSAAAAAESCSDNNQHQQRQQQQLSAQHLEHSDQTAAFHHEDEKPDTTGRSKDRDEAQGSENDSKSDSDDNGGAGQELLSQLKGMMPTQQQQAVLASQISAQVYDSALEQLGSRMLKAGAKGCVALGLGWLLHVDVLNTFRWDIPDLEQGLLWALPATAMAAVFAALPLPKQQQQQQPVAQAAASSSSSSSSTGSSEGNDLTSDAAFEQAKKKARNFMVASSTPLEFEISLNPNSEADLTSPSAKGPVTDVTPDAVVRALSLLQEGINRPWLIDMATPASRVISVIDEQLRRVSNEVLLRGFVATALAAGLSNTWATAGTSQESPFFYARLFGLITPQTSLAVAAGLLLLPRVPYLLLSSRPLSLYTRLSSLDVQLVGQLTEDDWMVKVVPAAAAAASIGGSSSSSSSSSGSSGEHKAAKGAVFGRLKQQQREQLDADAAAEPSSSSGSLLDQLTEPSSSSSSSSSSIKAGIPVIPDMPVMTQRQLDNQFEQLLVKVALFCAASSSSSSSSRDAIITSDQEQEGADLAAQILDIVELSAAVKAAAAAAGSSRVRKAGIANAKIASALKAVMTQMNHSRQQHYFIIRLGDVDDEEYLDNDEDDSSDSASESEDVVSVTDLARSASPAAKAAAARAAAAAVSARGSGACDKSTQERLDQAFHQVSGDDLAKMKEEDRMAVLGAMLQEIMKTSSYARVMAQGWRAAAAVPTAEDQITWCLLFIYSLLIELAPAGAFVATGGNVAASLVASCGYNVLATIVNDATSHSEREKLHKSLGQDWLLRLLPLQGRDG